MKKLILFILICCMGCNIYAQEMKKGSSMPEFSLKSSVYGDVATKDLKGKVVLVNLFATWCGPCQLELAEVEKTLWPKYKDHKDFVLLVVGREHTEQQLKTYNERKKFTFPLYPDENREVYSLFASQYIPRAYLFDKDGKLIFSTTGFKKEDFKLLMDKIEDALR